MKGIIFDLDGTLADSMETWFSTAARVLKEIGVTADREQCRKLFTFTYDDAAKWLETEFGAHCSGEWLAARIDGEMEDEYFSRLELKDDAKELLEKLYLLGVPMALATATERRLTLAFLERTGAIKYFAGVFTCGEAGAGKRESPAVYLNAAKLLGKSAEELWVFEDSPHAARTAKAAGFYVAGVFGRDNRKSLPQYCDVCFESLSPAEDVIAKIEKISG